MPGWWVAGNGRSGMGGADLQFADPIYKGRINPYIQEKAGDRFEDFTPEEWTIIRGSSDL